MAELTYQEENQELSDYFLEEYFYKYFREGNELRSLELIISPRCNLGCKYCYIHKYRDELFDLKNCNDDTTLTNLYKILHWLVENKMHPNLDIFSGELFAQTIGYNVLNIIYVFYKDVDAALRPKYVTIPTNFTFTEHELLIDEVLNIQNKFKSIGIELLLSASFDGLYMEDNRPFIRSLDMGLGFTKYSNEFYDKAFSFIEKTRSGIHPMIYSKNIEKWKENFLWFQEKMEQYNIPWQYIYLLFVRNEEWNKEEIDAFGDFVDFLMDWVWDKVGQDKEKYVDFLIKEGFNLLQMPLTSTDRGIGCSIQSTLTIRVSDLAVYPCHRLGYKDLHYGKLVPDDEKILRFESKNPELMVSIYSTTSKNSSYCAQCPINALCSGQCLGSCYESHKNIYVPIPSVCAVYYKIIIAELQGLKRHGVLDDIMDLVGTDKQLQIEYLRKEANI